MRLPTPPEVTERELGARGQVKISSENRKIAIRWCVGKGVPAIVAAKLTIAELQSAYDDETDATVHGWRQRRSDMPEGVAPVADALDAAIPAAFPEDMEIPFERPAPVAATPADAKAAQLLQILQSIGGVDHEAVEAIVESRLARFRELLPDFVAACSPVMRIEVQMPDGTTNPVQGIAHPNFATLLKLATSRGIDGFVPGIFIAGEASSGKTTGSRMLAEALGLPWRMNGAISMPHEMLGFIDGHGKYHTTPFRQAYEHGGVYTFDEVDRSDKNALLCVNPHLANGIAEFPDGQIKRHPNCIITATANTWGLGPDANYAGATKLDAAFLSRFPSRLPWDIDESTELFISGNESWCLRVQAARRRAREAGLKVMIDMRHTLAGAAHIANGMSPDDAAKFTYLANLKSEQRALVEVA
jgi:cobaltochelatase CobS